MHICCVDIVKQHSSTRPTRRSRLARHDESDSQLSLLCNFYKVMITVIHVIRPVHSWWVNRLRMIICRQSRWSGVVTGRQWWSVGLSQRSWVGAGGHSVFHQRLATRQCPRSVHTGVELCALDTRCSHPRLDWDAGAAADHHASKQRLEHQRIAQAVQHRWWWQWWWWWSKFVCVAS